jgi:hypothetical protein
VALILGNLQMLSVIKFIRFTVDAFPAYSTDVHYASRGLVFCSVGMWFATAVFIGMCGVAMDPTTGRGEQQQLRRSNLPRVVLDKRTRALSAVLEEEEPEFKSELEPESGGTAVDNEIPDESKCDSAYPQVV